jgi:RHS repeat-associated protein
LGSVRDVLDHNGTVLDHRNYDPFGNISSETNPSQGDRYGYTGRERDESTGFLYERGRSTNRDPVEFAAGDGNLYRYVANRPDGAVLVDRLGVVVG